MKKFGPMLLMLLLLLSGCTGGQEIESGLFVIAMAVDAAPEGNLTVTVKALSGTEDGASGASGGESASDSEAELEKTEPGYIVLSATAPSCLRALGLLGATTPRTVNLSQLREIVVSQTLAETDATLSILKEIRAIYRANGEAVVVVTPACAAASAAVSASPCVCTPSEIRMILLPPGPAKREAASSMAAAISVPSEAIAPASSSAANGRTVVCSSRFASCAHASACARTGSIGSRTIRLSVLAETFQWMSRIESPGR